MRDFYEAPKPDNISSRFSQLRKFLRNDVQNAGKYFRKQQKTSVNNSPNKISIYKY